MVSLFHHCCFLFCRVGLLLPHRVGRIRACPPHTNAHHFAQHLPGESNNNEERGVRRGSRERRRIWPRSFPHCGAHVRDLSCLHPSPYTLHPIASTQGGVTPSPCSSDSSITQSYLTDCSESPQCTHRPRSPSTRSVCHLPNALSFSACPAAPFPATHIPPSLISASLL